MSAETFNFRCLAYQEKDSSFTGVCLDLDIVEEGHRSLASAVWSIGDATKAHMTTVAEHDYPSELLFRPAPKVYWEKVGKFASRDKRPQRLPVKEFQFFTVMVEKVPVYV